MTREQAVLDGVTRVPGVRSALLVGAQDGLIVAESSLEGQNGEAVAALAGRLAQRLGGLTSALSQPPPSLFLLQCSRGQVFVAFGGEDLLLVAVTGSGINIGQVRLALLDAAGQLN